MSTLHPSRVALSDSSRLSSASVPRHFLLSLDNSTTVPVTLRDIAPTQTTHNLRLENIVSGTLGPPGKLYKSHAAAALLETLETGGSCARLALDETAAAEQRRVFDAFRSKLEEGGLVRPLFYHRNVPLPVRIGSVCCDGELRNFGLLFVDKRRSHEKTCAGPFPRGLV